MSKVETKLFNPNAAATKDAGIFGLPFDIVSARLVLLPVPWEVTTSYGGGTSQGPAAIFEASHQVDLFDLELGDFFQQGIAMVPLSDKEIRRIATLNRAGKLAAKPIIKAGGNLGKNTKLISALKKVNAMSEELNRSVYLRTKALLDSGKMVGLVGGDHSTPFGCIEAHLEKYPNLGILHFDAHSDLRKAYEGFTDSHASIMYNILERTHLQKLVQVGIRDFCDEEFEIIKSSQGRVNTFFDLDLQRRKFEGEHWSDVARQIVDHLPVEVYVSFDIDGLDPALCPNTGTPVPGGLSYHEALAILRALKESGRKIIGFDLNEVAPGPKGDEWNANVGARLLYKLCGYTLL